jgi:hypothetical protein
MLVDLNTLSFMCPFHILVAPSLQTGCPDQPNHLVQRLRPHTPKIMVGHADLRGEREERERERRESERREKIGYVCRDRPKTCSKQTLLHIACTL